MLLKAYSNLEIEVGTDEAGRGCLAGPVTAAAILINDKLENELINDSKKLSIGSRKNLRSFIEEHNSFFSIAHIYEDTIDEINILNASIQAMHNAISTLSFEPEFIIVDGNRFKPYKQIPHETIIKGDSMYLSIAAASILAKTYRDEYMLQLHEEFPMYGWDTNMGYPTKKHRAAILEYGPCKYHRKTFRLLPEQLVLDLNK
ncbi:ribonuclease HII [Paenimyroides baculatum]|uniref:Ribonuclease HII n=1 Tax=Paenimyroides baculatum TaxID=2608000 RepID=A0A5M6CHK9_9FLAO|nr:ribonuclease HII [Paenimyroides baculatum]KAA5532875.1 ribonuclease HII [Paenimyroides baculatum]